MVHIWEKKIFTTRKEGVLVVETLAPPECTGVCDEIWMMFVDSNVGLSCGGGILKHNEVWKRWCKKIVE